MKLINIQDSEFMLASQIIHLIWALPAFEQIPEFRGLQELCIITITPPASHLITPKKLSLSTAFGLAFNNTCPIHTHLSPLLHLLFLYLVSHLCHTLTMAGSYSLLGFSRLLSWALAILTNFLACCEDIYVYRDHNFAPKEEQGHSGCKKTRWWCELQVLVQPPEFLIETRIASAERR